MKKSTLAAVLGNVVSLLALWLVNFGVELTPEQQAEIVSALLLIVNTCALVIPALIAGFSRDTEPDPIQYPPNDEAGRALPALLMMLGLASVLLVSLQACTVLPKTPAQQLAYADSAFVAMVETASDLRDQSALTEQQVDRLGKHINRGNTVLDNAWSALRLGDGDRVVEYTRVISGLLVLIRDELEGSQ